LNLIAKKFMQKSLIFNLKWNLEGILTFGYKIYWYTSVSAIVDQAYKYDLQVMMYNFCLKVSLNYASKLDFYNTFWQTGELDCPQDL
jgi:hypothetical protein